MCEILYQGHGSVRLISDSGVCIYVDPFSGEGYDVPADVILVTHQHHDHNKTELPSKKCNCIIWQNADALVGGEYKTFEFGDVSVKAVEAYNANHSKDECVGYIIGMGGKKIYIAGDTSTTEQMSSFAKEHIDYAFLPIDGKFNMDAKEASACAKIIGCKYAIPYHMAFGAPFDMDIAQTFIYDSRLILEPGQKITF